MRNPFGRKLPRDATLDQIRFMELLDEIDNLNVNVNMELYKFLTYKLGESCIICGGKGYYKAHRDIGQYIKEGLDYPCSSCHGFMNQVKLGIDQIDGYERT